VVVHELLSRIREPRRILEPADHPEETLAIPQIHPGGGATSPQLDQRRDHRLTESAVLVLAVVQQHIRIRGQTRFLESPDALHALSGLGQ
jgi:hypothetical protein